MKNALKRSLSVLLAITIIFSSAIVGLAEVDFSEFSLSNPFKNFAIKSMAANSGTCGANLTWSLDDEGTLTISGTGAMNNYTDSSSAPWYSYRTSIKMVVVESGVKSIGSDAFYYCTRLTSVTIPDSVTSIGNYAFYRCTSLTSVTIPDSVTTIGFAAFSYCTSLISLTIPDSVKNIGNYAFRSCTSITSINIPDSITSIGDSVFEDCTSLTSINIHDGVASIGDKAFYGCTSLTSITIPDSVSSIGEYTFALTAYYNNSSNWENDVIYIGNHLIKSKTSINGGYILKNGTKVIANAAFIDCASLTSITIPDSVTNIGDWAFAGCTSLTSITIPDNVTNINSWTFGGCKMLKAASIGKSVKEIGGSAFQDCINLKKITIPISMEYIAAYAFGSCSNLEHIYYQGTIEQYKSIIIEQHSYTQSNVFNPALISAKKHYNSDKYGLSGQDLSGDGVTFSIFDKKPFFESSVTDPEYTKIKTANYEFKEKTVQMLDLNVFAIKYSELPGEVVVTNDEYQDYVIPSAVTESWKKTGESEFSVYMEKDRKDGKTYISSVFARNETADDGLKYVDVTTTGVNLLNKINVEVIVTAVEQNSPVKEYWLSQGQYNKIDDEDGVFDGVDLYSKFRKGETIYAYAVLENGEITEAVPLKLSKKETSEAAAQFLNGLESDNIKAFGLGGMGFTISDSIPIVGGTNISMGMFSLPFGVEVMNDRIRISLGVDLFKNNINGKDDSTYLWDNFKKSCKSVNSTVEDATDDMVDYYDFKNKFYPIEDSDLRNKKKNLDVSYFGYIEAYIIDGEIVFKDVCGSVALEFMFNYKQQFLVAGIPAFYAYVKAGAETGVKVQGARPTADSELPFAWEFSAFLEPSVKIGGGVGVKDAISAGIWGKGSMPLNWNVTQNHITLDLKGEMGVEAEFFVLSADKTLLEGSFNLINKYYSDSSKARLYQPILHNSNSAVDVFEEGEVHLADRSYLENTSDWLGGQGASTYRRSLNRSITPQAVTVSDLQTSVYKNSQTQLVNFGNTMMMVWVEDCAERDAYNRMRLMYSVYDVMSGSWKAPQPVADNGLCDGAPSLASDGENVYVAWQNIDTKLSTDDKETVDIIMQNAEIRLAKFNAATGSFENVKTVTDNSTYDYAPKVTVNNGIAEVYWVNSSTLDYQSGTLSIQKSDFNGNVTQVLSGLNYVHSLDSNGADISYTMDKDGDTSTTTDIKVYTNGTQVSVDYENAETSCTAMTYAELNGVKTLFYADDYNLYYIKDGAEQEVFEGARFINGNLQITSNGTETTAMWLEAGEVGTELYGCTYKDGEWSTPVQITSFSKVLSNVALTYFDNKLYGLFNRTHLEEVTSEVDGSTYYKNGTTDLCQLTTSGFNDVALSLFTVDESTFTAGEDATISILVKNNGTEKLETLSFTVTDTNGYSQVIEKEVKLKSGEAQDVELTYTVPETISAATLTVTANVNGDIDTSNNFVSADIGKPDLQMHDLTVRQVGKTYIVSGVLENTNLTAAQDVYVNAYLGEKTEANLFMEYIGTVEGKSAVNVEFLLDESLMDFTTNDYYDVTVEVESATTETADYDNSAIVCITKPDVHTHTVSEWIVDVEATCTTVGSRHGVCDLCKEEITEEIPAAHDYVWIIDKEATCTRSGSKHQKCNICGNETGITKIEATGHSYSTEWTIDTPATCTENGSKSHHCTNCEEVTDVTVITAIGHNYVAQGSVKEHPHTSTVICSFCEDTKTEAVIVDDCPECNFTFVAVSTTGYKITAYNGTAAEVIVPDSYKGLPVTKLENNCFKGNSIITSIEIPDSVTSFGSAVFYGCTSLESITIPGSVAGIGNANFYNCTNLKSITISDGVKSIGNSAFRGCTSLETVIIPESVTTIGTQAFYGFKGTIYCVKDSKAHTYADTNELNYVLVNILAMAEDTKIDYVNSIIYTSAEKCNDITEILSIAKSSSVVTNASHKLGLFELFGTSTTVSVYEGSILVDDYTLVVSGDTNGDSVCDVLDCFEVERTANGNTELSGVYAEAGDTNGDGVIDITDYQAIVNKAVS